MTRDYVWGLDLSGTLQGAGGIGGLLATTNSLTAKTDLYTFDANGNVGQLVDAADGTIAAHYEYDPFGNLLVADGPEAANNPFRFSTKYYDAEVGLHYYGYRYYSPKLGRWVTRDPIGEVGFSLLRTKNVTHGGKIFTTNFPEHSTENTLDNLLYAFVLNNPVGHVDLYGLRVDEPGCYRCGPDITDQLDATLDNIRNTFDHDWKTSEKEKVCTKLINILDKSHGGVKNAWDIDQLFWIGTGKFVPTDLIYPTTGFTNGRGDRCQYTVAYHQRCFIAGYLNYIMWGLMNQRCYQIMQASHPLLAQVFTYDNSQNVAEAWKLGAYKNVGSLKEVLAAVRAGYRSGEKSTGGCAPDSSLHNFCIVDKGNKVPYSGGTLIWTWEPMKPRRLSP